ncbi:MAG: Asp-tRNA(Asn)/Glu-tRNA(Gln) amidotransferase subunit GatB [Deltaproteobacteria bacterium]|nr:Asp-tRNA(Asn)/Glu-tRNA(Gln) amidotransferase subunit GatB [Deltaproteobacteria bacterium]
MATQWEMVVGLEVHAQLLTRTKIFCGCSTAFGAPPNTHVCPVCTGLPGALPVLNRQVVEYALMAALATHCTVARMSRFARKNYFYPDLPKGYQISQYELPITERGYLDITDDDGAPKRVGITRIHMEEDAGKLLHPEHAGADYSLVDLNRACVPLLEIVSEPDLRSSREASQYARKLREILVYLGICDGNMNEGSLRVDANVSVRRLGDPTLGTRAEIKNVNSFRFLEQALEFERDRQIERIEDGGQIVQETRLFDAERGITLSMRSKEEAHDYRYFPDPDLLPLVIEPEWVERVRAALPELPDAKRARFQREYGLPDNDTELLCQSRADADLFEETVRLGVPAKTAANWLIGSVLPERGKESSVGYAFDKAPQFIADMHRLIEQGAISANLAKNEVIGLWSSGKTAEAIVAEKGLAQISDTGALKAIVDAAIAAHPKEAEAFRGGKTQLLGFFVGQVMKQTQGKANPGVVNEMVRRKLGS